MAESFGLDAERYDRARPPYPDELITRIIGASPGREVLSVGCGTGIDARQFADAGCHVLGVDPDARMAEVARRGGIAVEVAKFEDWDPAGRTFDIVAAGQAWHWVDPAAGSAKAAEVLRPNGLLAVYAHVFAPPVEVAEPFAEVFQRVVPDAPFVQPTTGVVELHQAGFRKHGDAFGPAFGEPEQWRFDWERRYTRDEWLALLPTTGGLTRVPADKLAAILEVVGAAIDDLGGEFTMPYTTLAVTAKRVG